MRDLRLLAKCVLVAVVALCSPVFATLAGGTLAITDHALDPKTGSFEKDLKKAVKAALKKQGEGWHVYFVAYLKKAAGATEVNVVFYDITEKNKREQINAFPIGTQDSAQIIMSDFEISSEQGFKEGHKYDVLVTRLVGGNEYVYAKAKLELLK